MVVWQFGGPSPLQHPQPAAVAAVSSFAGSSRAALKSSERRKESAVLRSRRNTSDRCFFFSKRCLQKLGPLCSNVSTFTREATEREDENVMKGHKLPVGSFHVRSPGQLSRVRPRNGKRDKGIFL